MFDLLNCNTIHLIISTFRLLILLGSLLKNLANIIFWTENISTQVDLFQSIYFIFIFVLHLLHSSITSFSAVVKNTTMMQEGQPDEMHHNADIRGWLK